MTDRFSPFKTGFAPVAPRSAADDEIKRLRLELEKANATFAKFKVVPAQIGTVFALCGEERGFVTCSDGRFECPLPEGCAVGTQVRLFPGQHGGPMVEDKYEKPVAFGNVVMVSQVLGDSCMVTIGQLENRVAIADGLSVVAGDRVELDPTDRVALRSISGSTAFRIDRSPGISWDDIGGLEDAKEALREAIEYPVTHAKLYATYGARVSKGVLLSGPPGNGKTLLAKAVATSVSKDLDGLIYVKGPEILSKFSGEAEGKVRALFGRARAYKARTGNPAVVFVDEADAILYARGSGGINEQSHTIVPAFLNEMDGMEASGAFVLLATNRPEILDPAVVREGRIDRKIRIGRPDRAAARVILELAMRGRPIGEGSLSSLVELVIDRLFSKDFPLFEIRFADRGHTETVHLRDAVSGALIAGLVDRATKLALARDRSAGVVSGLGLPDFYAALDQAHRERADEQHGLLVEERAELVNRKPVDVRRLVSNSKEQPRGAGGGLIVVP